MSLSFASGLDKLTPCACTKVPSILKAVMFNIWMLIGVLPMTRMVFIPKVGNPPCPSQCRPISVSTVALRHFHKILDRRITSSDLLDDRQRACIEADGSCDNVAVLDAILANAKHHLREMHVATLDMAKAFDTVSHHVLAAITQERGLLKGLVQYERSLYSSASTRVEVRGALSAPIRVTRGVR